MPDYSELQNIDNEAALSSSSSQASRSKIAGTYLDHSLKAKFLQSSTVGSSGVRGVQTIEAKGASAKASDARTDAPLPRRQGCPYLYKTLTRLRALVYFPSNVP